jgi:diphthine-ammonia ligase
VNHVLSGRRACVSFSGGKDSCLALWRARREGLEVCTLINVHEETGARNRSHGVPKALLQAQASALGCDLLTPIASWQDYERQFTSTLRELRQQGTEIAIFGDIDLQAHRDWEEKVCAAAGLVPWLPLWQEPREQIAREVIREGFEAYVVCTDSRYLADEYCGRRYDARFLEELPPGVDACGENGEFHTFVCNGPMFRAPVPCAVVGFDDYIAPASLGGVRYRFARLA